MEGCGETRLCVIFQPEAFAYAPISRHETVLLGPPVVSFPPVWGCLGRDKGHGPPPWKADPEYMHALVCHGSDFWCAWMGWRGPIAAHPLERLDLLTRAGLISGALAALAL